MRKSLMILLCAVTALSLTMLPFLCTHPSMLPEKTTEYYEKKAQADAMNATGPEAELMRLLLGSTPAPMTEEAETFPLSFSGYGLILAVGALSGMLFLMHKKEASLRPALLWTAALSVPMGLLGARLVYCLTNLSFYLADIAAPEAMLKIWEGGLSLCGALSFVALAGVLGAKLGKAPIGRVLDCLAPPLLFAALIAALADRYVMAGFGPELDAALPLFSFIRLDTIRLDSALLTAIAMSALLLGTSCISFLRKSKAGHRFALTAFLYGGSMIFLESLRRDGHMLWGFVHAEMVFFLIFALCGLLFLAQRAKRLPLSLLSTILLSALVIGLEFALDRSNVGDIWLYMVYFLAISAYLFLGYSCAKHAAKI